MLAIKRSSLILLSGLASATVSAAPVTQIPVREAQSSAPAAAPRYTESAQSELVVLVQQLQAEVSDLRGQVEEQQHRLKQLESEQRSRYRDIDRRLSALINAAASSPAASSSLPSGMADAPQVPSGGVDTGAAASAASAGAALSVSSPASTESTGSAAGGASHAYRDAFALVRARKFDDARQAFEAFIKRYPTSDHVANAYYWIGEVDLAQQQPAAARDAFKRVVTDFPNHIKVPDALYKLGVAYDQLGDTEASKRAFARVIKEFPQSSAAGLASNYAGQ